MSDDAYIGISITEVKYVVGVICSGISVAAIITLYILYFIRPRSTENVFFRMVIHMELPNALYAVTGFITYPQNISDSFCTFTGAIRQWALLSTSLWTLTIAFHIKNSIADLEIRPFSRFYYIFGYGLAIPFALIPIFFDLYQVTPIYCGIPLGNLSENLIVYYVPILTVLAGVCYCYGWVIRYLRKTVSKEAAQEFYPLFLYPVLVVLYNIGSFIYLMLDFYLTQETLGKEILVIITTGVLQAQGLFDVLVYSLNYAIREEVKLKMCPSQRSETNREYDPNFKSRFATIDGLHRGNSTLVRPNPNTSNLEGSDVPYHNVTAATV